MPRTCGFVGCFSGSLARYSTLHKQIAAPTESICSCEYLAPALNIMKSQTVVERVNSSVQVGTNKGEEGLRWQVFLDTCLSPFDRPLESVTSCTFNPSCLQDLGTSFLISAVFSPPQAPFCLSLPDSLPCPEPFLSFTCFRQERWPVTYEILNSYIQISIFADCVGTEIPVFTGLEKGVFHDHSPLCSICSH